MYNYSCLISKSPEKSHYKRESYNWVHPGSRFISSTSIHTKQQQKTRDLINTKLSNIFSFYNLDTSPVHQAGEAARQGRELPPSLPALRVEDENHIHKLFSVPHIHTIHAHVHAYTKQIQINGIELLKWPLCTNVNKHLEEIRLKAKIQFHKAFNSIKRSKLVVPAWTDLEGTEWVNTTISGQTCYISAWTTYARWHMTEESGLWLAGIRNGSERWVWGRQRKWGLTVTEHCAGVVGGYMN